MSDAESPQDRRARFLQLADEAKKLGSIENRVTAREYCLHIAEAWLQLAGAESQQEEEGPISANATRPK